MAQQTINIGSSANKGDGDPLRTAFDKINDNFTELYARDINTDAQTLTLVGNTLTISGGNSVTLNISPTGDLKGSVFADDSTLLVDGVNGKLIGPLLTENISHPSNDGLGIRLNSTDKSTLLVAKQSFDRTFDRTFDAGYTFSMLNTPNRVRVTFDENNGLYFRGLLERWDILFDNIRNNTPSDFEYDYSNIRLSLEPDAHDIVTNVVDVVFVSDNVYDIEIDQDPIAALFNAGLELGEIGQIALRYDYNNTMGFDVERNRYGIAVDHEDIDLRAGRDIDLFAVDDFRARARSSFNLTLESKDGRDPESGININLESYDAGNFIDKIWTFQFDGNLRLPNGGDIVDSNGNSVFDNITGLNNNNDVNITINNVDSTTYTWNFGNTGALTFPDATVQSTAWTGNVPGLTYNEIGGTSEIGVTADVFDFGDGKTIDMQNSSILFGGSTVSGLTLLNVDNITIGVGGGINMQGSNIGAAGSISAVSVSTMDLTTNTVRNEGDIAIDINLSDSTLRTWKFTEGGQFETAGSIIANGSLRFPGVGTISGDDAVPSLDLEVVDGGDIALLSGNYAWKFNSNGTFTVAASSIGGGLGLIYSPADKSLWLSGTNVDKTTDGNGVVLNGGQNDGTGRGGGISLFGGNSAGGTGGSIFIETGIGQSGADNGVISIGTAYAKSVDIGRTGSTVNLNGTIDFTDAGSIQNFAPGNVYANSGQYLYVASKHAGGTATNVAFIYDTDNNRPRQIFYGKTEFGNNGAAPIVDFDGTTIQNWTDPNVVNTHGGSTVIAVGGQTATIDKLTVRLVNDGSNNIDVQFNYDPDVTSAISASGDSDNRFGGTTTLAPGNTTWTTLNSITAVGTTRTFTVSDHSFHKVYRGTVICRAMPDIGTVGDAYCILERLL